jgi:hypothetical protein
LADLAIRALTAADDQARYFDLRTRAFGPADHTRHWRDMEAVIADGRCLAAAGAWAAR